MNGIFEEIDAKMATHEPTDYAQQIAELRQHIGQLQQACLDIQCRLLKHFNDGHGPAQ